MTSEAPDEAVAAGNTGEQGPSAILETEEQRSLREYGGMSSISSKPVLLHGCYHTESNRPIVIHCLLILCCFLIIPFSYHSFAWQSSHTIPIIRPYHSHMWEWYGFLQNMYLSHI